MQNATTGRIQASRAQGPRPSAGSRLAVLSVALLLLAGPPMRAQVHDEVRIYANDVSNGSAESLVRFNRKLQVIAATSVKGLGGILSYGTPMGLDGEGRSWVAFDALNTMKLLRIDNQGALLPHAQLAHNPVNVVLGADGRAFASTRIGLSSPGPMYGVDADGNVLWVNSEGPALYNFDYPSQLAMTGMGESWLGGATTVMQGQDAVPCLVNVDTADGHVIQSLALPGSSTSHSGVCRLVPSGDGSLWSFACGGPFRWLFKTQGTQILNSFPINGGTNSSTNYIFHVDAQDRPIVLSLGSAGWNTKLLRYNPSSPAVPEAEFQFGGKIMGWALGATGEDAFAVVAPESVPLSRRLERVNLVTGARSSVPLDPAWTDAEMSRGDHTGWVYASAIDRNGDNDGDGASNGAETVAGSNPFDALCRPEGPKVYLSFAPTTNSIVLSYVDPDGLLDPTGGLDLSTLALLTGAGTNVFSFLLPFLTVVDVLPDGTQATATFGALPLPNNLKIRLEARVSDLSGAVGWDWQVTPPGDL
jgi:hypothetical protein